jgi:hypothetical protein
MAKIKPKEIFERLGEKPILTAIILFIIIWFLVSGASIKRGKSYKGEFLDSLLVEAHGLLFDIFVFGILIVFFNRIGERRRNIARWQEEIDDFRYWKSEEAMFRIMGNIKRLNRNGVTEINLTECFLNYADLSDTNLRGADLSGAHLKEADFRGANLERTRLIGANLEEALFRFADLKRADLLGANLRDIDFRRANLEEADLSKAHLEEAYFREANLKGADLWKAHLEKASFLNADLEEANLEEAYLEKTEELTIEQISQVRTLYQAKLDSELEKQIKEQYPHLLEKPKEEDRQKPKFSDLSKHRGAWRSLPRRKRRFKLNKFLKKRDINE